MTLLFKRIFALTGLLFSLLVNHSVLSQEQVKYEVQITDPHHHYAEVTVLFPETDSHYLDISMPTWRLGYYKVLNLANGLRHLKATDLNGESLVVNKINKHSWRIRLDKPGKVAVSYQLYANFLERRARHIDDTHAYLDGVSSFIFASEFIDNPIQVSLEVPKGWRSRSGMQSNGRHRFVAENYHILASSPIESGFHEFYEFEVDDKDIELVIWGKGNFDAKKIISDYKKMIQVQGKLWGQYPFDRYVFILHVNDGLRGATEHINSTVIQRSPLSFESKKDYLGFMSLSSHEFVHTWNVKAYRPEGMAEYNYTEENYSDLLWITEGSTSYLGDLLLARAEIYPLKKYLQSLAQLIKDHDERPGSQIMTAQQASFDVWIEEGGHRAINDGVSIYSKGESLSLMMDLLLVADSQGRFNYGDLHRLLYQRFPVPDKGFSAQDIKQLMTELTNKDYTTVWNEYMEGTSKIDFNDLLKPLGLVYYPHGNSDNKDKQVIDTGLSFHQDSNRLKTVLRGTSAWRAGLTVGDEIIAINGIRLQPNTLAEVLASYQGGDEIEVSLFRRNRLLDRRLSLESSPAGKPTIEMVSDPDESQKQNFETWLGLDWPDQTKAVQEDLAASSN